MSGCEPYTTLGEGSISSYCLVTPECSEVIGVPAHIVQQAVIGWNAGANSIDQLDGSFHTVFTMPAVAGVVIGLRSDRAHQSVPDFIEHGLYFKSLQGVSLVNVIERGVEKTRPVLRSVTDTFEIRRVGTRVTYWHNGALMHMSAARSIGAKIINTCLYASGDEV